LPIADCRFEKTIRVSGVQQNWESTIGHWPSCVGNWQSAMN